jgi:molecular chaperone DnaK
MGRPVGIDLGTTRSAVACVDENGRPRILADGSGISLVPSVVLFDDSNVLVGEIARDAAVAFPEQVVECIKRRIGDPSWRFIVGNRAYNAIEISALILKEMKRIAEEALESPVTEAVITVPAYFHDADRRGTIQAAEMAGLKVLKIVHEPTAAAIYYSFEDESGPSLFLVYDLGGGTFDITIMRRLAANSIETLCTRGNHFLGGKNWDERLVDYVASRFATQHNTDPRLDMAALYDLNLRCERAKITLTEKARTQVVCQHQGKSLSTEIGRETFDELTADLLKLTEDEVDRALKEVKLTPADLGIALLVGGSSKMPMVQTMMKGKAPAIKMSRDPDHCVALGAALEAARLSQEVGLYKPAAKRFLESSSVTDRTPHGLGLIALEGKTMVNAIIIPKNTPLPCEMSREDITTNYDGQTSVEVHLVQGEDQDALSCVPVATYEFSGIPNRKAGQSVIRITYRYNENNVVEVSALDVRSKQALEKNTVALVDLMELRRQMEQVKVKVRERRVVLLMDSSGSMASRMDKAKEACLQFISNTDFESVEMGLVQFGINSAASVLHTMSRDEKSLGKKVDSLKADGSTPMHEALRIATELLAGAGADFDNFIVLFTDGYPDSRPSTVRATEEAKQRGIRILCIGIGAADQALLDELATTPGEVEFSKSGEELVTTFGNVARLISGRRV